MNVREKLVELIESARYWGSNTSEEIADTLLDNGVTVHKSICPYCCDNGVGHGMLKHSYDDESKIDKSRCYIEYGGITFLQLGDERTSTTAKFTFR